MTKHTVSVYFWYWETFVIIYFKCRKFRSSKKGNALYSSVKECFTTFIEKNLPHILSVDSLREHVDLLSTLSQPVIRGHDVRESPYWAMEGELRAVTSFLDRFLYKVLSKSNVWVRVHKQNMWQIFSRIILKAFVYRAIQGISFRSLPKSLWWVK